MLYCDSWNLNCNKINLLFYNWDIFTSPLILRFLTLVICCSAKIEFQSRLMNGSILNSKRQSRATGGGGALCGIRLQQKRNKFQQKRRKNMPKSLGSNYFLVSHHSHTTLTTDDYTTVDRTPFDQYILKLTHLQRFWLVL